MSVPKKLLITGGAGFIGSHLCERLLSDGHDVLCVDNYFTGVKDNIAHLMDNPRFEIMRHDVTFPLYVEVCPRERAIGARREQLCSCRMSLYGRAELGKLRCIAEAAVRKDSGAAHVWLRNENRALGGRPLDQIKTIAGLINGLAYLDSRRAPL